jgi:hypothetical protein
MNRYWLHVSEDGTEQRFYLDHPPEDLRCLIVKIVGEIEETLFPADHDGAWIMPPGDGWRRIGYTDTGRTYRAIWQRRRA